MDKKIIEKYIGLFSNLTPKNVRDFDNLVSKDIIFFDPFNNVKGVENFKKILNKFLSLNVKLKNKKRLGYQWGVPG